MDRSYLFAPGHNAKLLEPGRRHSTRVPGRNDVAEVLQRSPLAGGHEDHAGLPGRNVQAGASINRDQVAAFIYRYNLSFPKGM